MPDYRFRCLGPFYFPVRKADDGTRLIDHIEARDSVFWEAEKAAKRVGINDIWNAVGLYVMGLKPSGTARTWPYYVGKAASQPLYKRCFQKSDKPRVYSAILNNYQKARPFMYLFPLVRVTGVQVPIPDSKQSRVHDVINDAEYMMISTAMRVNPWLWNIQHKVALDRFAIDGTPQAKMKETQDARAFREMMGFMPKADQPAADKAMIEASEKAVQHEDEIQRELDEANEAELEIESPPDEPTSEGSGKEPHPGPGGV